MAATDPAHLPRDPAASQRRVPVWRSDEPALSDDSLVVEEPLELRLGDESLLITMRTPGADLDLVRGLLFTEGFVESPNHVAGLAYCRDVPDEARGNVVAVSLARGIRLDPNRTARAGLAASSCGVCGKASLEALALVAPPVADGPVIDGALLARLPDLMRARQTVFSATGGLHAAALFDLSGQLLAFAEDVGRHNAVDKVVGQVLRFLPLPLSHTVLLVSGRAGFEIVQKARRAAIAVLCSVSAPSSLAVDLAVAGNQTLVGFLRGSRFNVYSGWQRLGGPAPSSPPSELVP